jgi:hypothetical protein
VGAAGLERGLNAVGDGQADRGAADHLAGILALGLARDRAGKLVIGIIENAARHRAAGPTRDAADANAQCHVSVSFF